MSPRRLWIDTDLNPPEPHGPATDGTNVDDAVALLAAVAHPEVELVGISTVGPEPEHRAAAAAELLAGAGFDPGSLPIVAGGWGPASGASPTSSAAVVRAVAGADVEALLAIGPLTNVAALTAAGVRPPEVTIMGGALRPVEHRGERRTVEYNFGCDPGAAAAVLAVDGTVLVPLDATVATRLDDRLRARLVAAAPVLGPMVDAWVARWGSVFLHDPAALLIAAGEATEFGRFERHRLVVEPDGHLISGGRAAGGGVHDVVTSLFGSAVVASVLALLSGLDLAG